MALIQRHKWTWDEVQAGLTLLDPLLFALAFWEEDLTIAPSRLDLPKKWRGKQVVTLEQRRMAYDGAVYRLWRDVLPELAAESSQKVAHRTSRKIGKTLLMEAAIIQVAVTKTVPGIVEGMVHAPRENHMAPLRNRIEKKLTTVPLFDMLRGNFDRQTGILNFRNGWIWHFRIEGGCVHGDTEIIDADSGEIFKIGDMLDGRRPVRIHTVNSETFEMLTTDEYDVIESGEQELFEVVTEDNWSVKTTFNHPFLTPQGWRGLNELAPGDHVAAAGALRATGDVDIISGDDARLLGYFIGDGCTVGNTPLFTNDDPGIVDDWRQLCERFGNISIKELQTSQYCASDANGRGNQLNPLIRFLAQYGVWGKHADAKCVPVEVFRSTDDVVAEFLAGLIACDGSIAFKENGAVVISFASINRALVNDVALLLLRFGIKTRLEYRKADDKRMFGNVQAKSKELWSLRMAATADLERFCENIRLRGRKGERQKYIVSQVLPGRIEGGHGLTIPVGIINDAITDIPGMNPRKLLLQCESGGNKLKGSVRYSNAARYNDVLKSEKITNLLTRDVVWVQIKSITSVGIDRTYDLVVPSTHSFVGSQCILHNSLTGTNMVGLRGTCMIGDEADYSQDAAYNEREQTALPGCAQLWGGVPRGVRGTFWRVCNIASEGKGWSIQRHDMRANPLYHSQAAFADQVKGDWYSQRVQTQVLGRDGEEAVSSFPVIPVDAGMVYTVRRFSAAEYAIYKDALPDFLNLPIRKIENAEAWMIHLDYGYAPSPTELGISYLRDGTWNMLARIEMMRIDNQPMATIIHTIDTQVLPQRAALIITDAHGQGRGVLSVLQDNPAWEDEAYILRAVSVGFEGSTPVPGVKAHRKCKQPVRLERDGFWTCDTCKERLYNDNELSDATVSTKAFLSNELKEAFANGQRVLDEKRVSWPDGISIVLGDDSEIMDELSGTTEIQSQGGTTRYITPHDVDHLTDMLRCLVSGAARFRSIATDYNDFDEDYAAAGWLQTDGVTSNWEAPW